MYPYVEHDTLTLVIDLILLKKAVFIHLIYNQRSEPRRVVSGKKTSTVATTSQSKDGEEWERYQTTAKLGIGLVLLDAVIRCSHLGLLSPDLTSGFRIRQFALVLFHCIGETIAFHTMIICTCYFLIPFIGMILPGFQPNSISADHGNSPKPESSRSDIRNHLKLSHVPLTIFYSSLTKFFLLSLLSIWHTSQPPETAPPTSPFEAYPIIHAVWMMFDEAVLDREWVVRNILGGLAAGFGLRVVLDCHPIFVTFIIGSGWIAKVIFADFVSEVTAFGETAWMKYSIP
ncbi:hypothetical protein FRB96_005627 [Tulasnella sp. 330]|nr:hypothetical protein FRB96_005627 [Tulasnella sp. 330]